MPNYPTDVILENGVVQTSSNEKQMDNVAAHTELKDNSMQSKPIDGNPRQWQDQLTNPTKTLADFADGANDTTIPTSVSFTTTNGALSQLCKEIAVFYDAVNPIRLKVNVAGSAAGNGGTIPANSFTLKAPQILLVPNYVPYQVGDAVKFEADAAPFEAAKVYYVKSIAADNLSFTLSATPGGATVALSSGDIADANVYLHLDATTEVKYMQELKSIKFNDLQKQALGLAKSLKKFTTDLKKINRVGAPAKSIYPSGKVF